MDKKKVIKYNDFHKHYEAMYKVENGEFTKQDYEFYSDFYPEKFRYATSSNDTKKLYDSNKVWVLKHNDKIIATFSDEIDENKLRECINKLKD